MADDVVVNPETGVDVVETIAFDEIGAKKHQRVKMQYGVDGVATDVSDTNPLPIDDAGGSITVDGTVTANLSATDNAVLDAIEADTSVLAGAVDAGQVQVDIVSGSVGITGTATVSGTVTANLSATDNAVLDAIEADASSLVAALYTQDAAAPTDPVAPSLLAVRDDSLSTLTAAEGDWAVVRVNAQGALWVEHDGVLSIPAADRSTDSMSCAHASDAVMLDQTPVTPKFGVISESSSGDNTVVTAVTDKKIRVLTLTLSCDAEVDATWKSGASTAISGAMPFDAKGGYHAAPSAWGHFETAAGEALVLNLSGAVLVAGHLTYIEV